MAKYKTKEGDYLIIDESRSCFRIYWHIAATEDCGGALGELAISSKEEPPTDRSEWEIWTADRAVAPLAEGRDTHGFYFETERKAKEALLVANTALAQERPLPDWATKALVEGWKPPKGWRA